MEKVYCSLCKHCDENHYSVTSYTCKHPRHLTDTFYGRSWDSPYCDRKNRDNDCTDFEIRPEILRKAKRKEWIASLKNKIRNAINKSLQKVINRFGVTMRNSHQWKPDPALGQQEP